MINKIALFGQAGSGKDYLTKKIIEHYKNKNINVQRIAFADNVKRNIKVLLNLSDKDYLNFLYNEDFKNKIYLNLRTFEIKKIEDTNNYHLISSQDLNKIKDKNFINDIWISFRELTVYYGTYVMQKSFGKLVWVNSIKSLINDNYLNIITDLRFEHEYDFCINNKFKIIKVNNLNNTLNVNNIAENYYSLFKENYVFYNYI